MGTTLYKQEGNVVKRNIPEMKKWIEERYKSSTFNICSHQPTPLIKADPIRIHIDPEAIPKPALTAATVPIHFREAVKEQIKQDVEKGVIEPVKSGVQ